MICFLIYWSDKIKRAKGESQSALIVQGYSLISITEYHFFVTIFGKELNTNLNFLISIILQPDVLDVKQYYVQISQVFNQAANIQGLKIRVGKECFISFILYP